ncbi:MAG: c-type cytochrome [Flavobacteriales bacterium]|nr:c-type cytochrome [Flavobacteriales bacterium]
MNRWTMLGLAGAAALLTNPAAKAQDGAAIFKQNCTACHKIGKRLVGPDLTGVTEKQSEEWLRKFIHSSQGLVKAGDPAAVAIWEEFNKTPMPDFQFSDAELTALLGYLAGFSKQPATAGAAPVQEEEPPLVFTVADVEQGRALFQHGMSGGGPSCVSCHHVAERGVIDGGLLAKDLTHVAGRIGDQGIVGILGAPPFPAMAAAYNGRTALTDQEVHALTAFLVHAGKNTATTGAGGKNAMSLWGSAGLVVILLGVALTWARRLRRPVRHAIDERQLRTI